MRTSKIKDLVLMIHELTQSSSELKIGKLNHRPTEIWRMYTDATIARSELDWEPRVNFKEGLIKTINWHKMFLDIFVSLDHHQLILIQHF